MSGLFANLSSTVGSLNAHSRSIETAGKNLANVNNPNYARQRVVYGDRGTVVTPQGAYSLGLEALGVQQLRDTLLDRQVVREGSLTSYFETQQKAYQRAQAALGQNITSAGTTATGGSTTTDTGIAAAIDDLFSAFHSFAGNPTDTGVRQGLIQKASILTDRVRLADTRLAQAQSDLEAQAQSDVTEANRLLETIADLNDQIARFEVDKPGTAVDLRDQRQAALEKLAAKLPFTSTETSDGRVLITADSGGGPIDLIDAAGVTGTTQDAAGVTLTLVYNAGTGTVSDGASATALDLSVGGSIQGAIAAEQGAVQTLRDQLTLLTRQMVTSVNAIYNDGDTTADFFDDTAPVTASSFKLAAGLSAGTLRAGDPANAGDNTLALAIAKLATYGFTGTAPDLITGSFAEYYASAVSELGQAVAGATARFEDQTRIEQLVRSQRDAVSGVSLDEELADLMKYQRAFQASSRVFQTIDKLLGVVVEELGR